MITLRPIVNWLNAAGRAVAEQAGDLDKKPSAMTGKDAAKTLLSNLDWSHNLYSFKELEEVANNKNTSKDLKEAIQYFVDHKDEFSAMETNSTGSNDNIISKVNVKKFIADENAIGEYNSSGLYNYGLKTTNDIATVLRTNIKWGYMTKKDTPDDGTYSLNDLNYFVQSGQISDPKTIAAIRLCNEHKDKFDTIDSALFGAGNSDGKISMFDTKIISENMIF